MMKMSSDPRQTESRRRWYLLLPLVAVMLCSGCWSGPTEFQFNWVYVAYQEREAGGDDSSDAFSQWLWSVLTLPVVFLVSPCVCAGAFLLKMNEGGAWEAIGSATLTLAASIQR